MIRGSVVIAAVAIAVSLIVHLLGLGITIGSLPERSSAAPRSDSVALSNAFEDLAEETVEPAEPEPAETPEPPEETQPEPERTEPVPITDTQVASDDPQRTPIPDTGRADLVLPEVTEPVEPSDSADDAEGRDKPSADEATSDPVEQDTVAETPEGRPDAVEEPVEPAPAETSQLAALPDSVAPVTPDDAQTLPVTPVIPVEPELVEPDIPETVESVEEEPPRTGDATEDSELAVTASIRPRRPEPTSPDRQRGTLNGSRDFSNLRFPKQTIDSPLSVYRREGIDNFTFGNGGSASGGRGPGNSDVTNYAGQVLVHLNRAPVVFVSARGFAQVFFQIDPDGSLAWVEIVDSSGSPEVERAARQQVRAAEPFPRPPSGTSRKLSFFYQNN